MIAAAFVAAYFYLTICTNEVYNVPGDSAIQTACVARITEAVKPKPTPTGK
jgi:hypothetical protein